MKKIYSLIASVVLAASFTACTQNDMVETSGPDASATSFENAIQFGTYMGKNQSTRAAGSNQGGKGGAITTDGTGSTNALQDTKTGSATQGFGVYAFNTGTTAWSTWSETPANWKPNFMHNEHVYWDGSSKFIYDDIKYWPNGNSAASADDQGATGNAAKLSFFAYAPYVNDGATIDGVNEDGGTTGIVNVPANTNSTANLNIHYVLPTDVKANASGVVDLLWGLAGAASYDGADGVANSVTLSSVYNTDLTKVKVAETIDFLFKHALAKVAGGTNGIQIVADIDDGTNETGGTMDAKTLITVSSVTIRNSENASNVSEMFASGDFDIATGTWSNQDFATDDSSDPEFSYTYTTDIVNNIKEPADWAAAVYDGGWKPDGSSAITGVTTTAANLLTSAPEGFLLIPGTGTQKIKVSVTYTVRTYDSKLAAQVNGEGASGNGQWTKVVQTIENVVTLPATLAPNHYYGLKIHLGLTSVKFSATVAEWEDGSTGGSPIYSEIWLPANVQ